MDILYWLILIIAILLVILFYGNYFNKYFEKCGVNNAKNVFPFLGNMSKVFFNEEHLLQSVYKAYNSFPEDRYIGFYAFNIPTIIIRDLDLIKTVTIKDFDHFIDHKVFMDEDDDPLFGRNLFFLRGQKWRDMRLAMSPAYTGSKMKNMLPFVMECATQLTEYFKLQSNKEKSYIEVEMKDVFTRFTNDVIASTAFGVRVNSLRDKNNKFYEMGKKATNFSGVQFFKFFGYASCPIIMKLFKIPLFSKDVSTFFRNLIFDAIKSREMSSQEMSIPRYDMVHLLMLAKKGSLSYEYDPNIADENEFGEDKASETKVEVPKREWSHDDLTAQAVAFLLAGFDTSSALLCFTAYELAMNVDIQLRLQAEIDETRARLDGNLKYSDLQKMKYLDMVILESLRMWPPDSQLERVCVKPYELPQPNDKTNKKYQMNIGDDVWIPTYSIHHDPKYHPNPEVFDPERFSEVNRPHMLPLSFIPFGAGPRLCIGARFAVMEAKVMIFELLSDFNIVQTEKTPVPLKLASNTFTLHAKSGFWLGLKPRIQ